MIAQKITLRRALFFIFLSLTFYTSAPLSDTIIQTDEIQTLYDTVQHFIAQGIKPQEIAIACDMDETLVTTYLDSAGQKKDFPQSRFFDFLKKELKELNSVAGINASDDARFNRANDIVTFLQTDNILKTQFMEPTTQSLIASLQEQQVHVFILTARPSFAAERTNNTLKALDLTLRPCFLKNDMTIIDESIGCCFMQGVLYAQKGKIDKGDALARFFSLNDYKPKVLIAIDDRQEYLTGIENALESWKDTIYRGIWYRRAERWYIDEQLAHNTLEKYFGKAWWSVTTVLRYF